MIKIRRSEERGRGDRGWLKSHFSFSFADYHDSARMGYSALRVINEDHIAPGAGFGPHAHRDMEILTYVLEGQLLHRDSMGQRHLLGPNEIQMMSAGTGVIHSEYNASETEPVHLFQIWILPATEDLKPAYQQFAFSPVEKQGRLRLLASRQGSAVPVAATIQQDARVYAAQFSPGETASHALDAGRHAWVQVVKGNVSLNGQDLRPGDAAEAAEERELSLTGIGPAGGEVLLFDLP
jgi:quercetin 2,3-dioxygenase